MDRKIIYQGAIPLSEDMLSMQRFGQRAISAVLSSVFGPGATIATGFAATPTAPASLSFQVAPGSLLTPAVADATAYGVLPADTTTLLKQGDLVTATTFPVTAPSTAGQSVVYLVQVTYQEIDDTPVTLAYYNAANPAQGWSGPGNSGTAQATARRQKAVLSLKQGAPANTGNQQTPSADTGYFPLWTVTVAAGQTTVTAGNIVKHVQAPFTPFYLQNLAPGFSRAIRYENVGVDSFVVPNGVARVRVRVVGGGGGGANSSSNTPGGAYSSGGGGGAGGYAEGVYVVSSGQVIPITVGAGGGAQTAGGTSSFGSFASATGGQPASSSAATSAGGYGGIGVGGTVLNAPGGYGSDGQSSSYTGMGNGAPGPWGGGGRAAAANGIPGQAPGAGGGGSYNGTFVGGSGAPGIVIVEY